MKTKKLPNSNTYGLKRLALACVAGAAFMAENAQGGLDSLIGQWAAGTETLADTSGYGTPGTHDGVAVGGNAGSLAYSTDVPSYFTGSKSLDLTVGDVGVQIANSSTSDGGTYVNTFDGNIQSQFTVAFWAKGFPDVWAPWVSKRGEDGIGWQYRRLGDSSISTFTIRGIDSEDGNGEGPDVSDGNWHHFAGVWDQATGTRTLYVDGVLATVVNNDPSQNYTLADDKHLALGARQNGGGDGYESYFSGKLFDVRIYSSTLSAEEVNTVMTSPVGPPSAPTGLVATPWHHSVHLTWDPKPGVSGYKVDRLDGSGGAVLFTYDTSVPSYTDTTVTSGGPYYYVVRGTNISGAGDPSAEAYASPSADPVDQTITFALGSSIAKWSTAVPFADTATSTSGRAVTYSCDNLSVADVNSSGQVTLTGAIGTAHIRANRAADADFNAAPQAEQLLTVNPLTTDADHSTVAVSLPSLWADGYDYSTITVTLKNVDDVIVPDKPVTLTSSRGGTDTVSGSPGTSDSNGVVTFTVKSSTVGSSTYTVKDTAADVTLSTTPTITYVAAPTPFTSYVTGSTEFKTWDFHGSTYAGWWSARNTILTAAGVQMGAPIAGNDDHGAWIGMMQSTDDLSALPFSGFGVEIKFNAPNMTNPTDSLELLTVRSTQEDPREGYGISGNGGGGSIRGTQYGQDEVNFGNTNDLVGCHTLTLVRTGTTVRTYVDGRVINTRTTTDVTKPMLHFGLGLNEYNGNSYWPVGAVVSKITAFTVTPSTGPAVINVALGARGNDPGGTAVTRYGANGNYMNGTPAGATTAPLTYGGTTWNDKQESGSNLLDSDGFPTTVSFTTPQYKSIVGDWWDTPGVLKLSDGAALHADSGWGGGYSPDNGTIPSILLTGLDTAKKYQLAIVLPGRNERTVNFNVGGTVVAGTDPYFWTMSGGTTTTATNPANLSTFVPNENYVLLTGLVPNSSGEIQVYAERRSGGDWALAGFQLTESPTDYGIWALGYLPADVSKPAADYDGDGMTNFQEYAFGLNPTSGKSVNPIAVPFNRNAGTFSYTRRATPLTTGLTYTVWTSQNLANWTKDTGAHEGTAVPVGDVETVPVTISADLLLLPHLFVRVQAE